MKLRHFRIIAVMFLVGCSAQPLIELPNDPELPGKWGHFSSMVIPNSSCSDVSGQFEIIPERYKMDGNEALFLSGDEYEFYSLFPFDLATSKTRKITSPESSRRFLRLQQNEANQIELTHIWANGDFVEVNSFSAVESDFICANGYIEFPIVRNDGQIEGSTLNGQIRRRIRKAEDGSLIVTKTFGPLRSSSAVNSSEIVHEFYRFAPEDPDAR